MNPFYILGNIVGILIIVLVVAAILALFCAIMGTLICKIVTGRWLHQWIRDRKRLRYPVPLDDQYITPREDYTQRR